jgi:sodium-independent sulfate anion transporter 11
MLRSAFVNPSIHASTDDESSILTHPITSANSAGGSHTEHAGITIPGDAVVIQFNDSVFYPNAGRGKRSALEAIKIAYSKVSNRNLLDDRERSWSVSSDKRIERLRKERNISPKETPLHVVIWDLTMVPFIDVTAILVLGELKEDIRRYSGNTVQFRIVGISRSVRERFLRAQWKLTDLDDSQEDGADVVYPSIERAVLDREGSVLEAVIIGTEKTG